MSDDGLSGLTAQLAPYASDIKHISICNVNNNTIQQKQQYQNDLHTTVVNTLLNSLTSGGGNGGHVAKVESIHLGSCILNSNIWDAFRNQNYIQSLYLDDVIIDGMECLQTLERHLDHNDFKWTDLKEFHISLKQNATDNNNKNGHHGDKEVANNILSHFRSGNLRYLCWKNIIETGRQASSYGVPYFGIGNWGVQLRILHLEGASLTDDEFFKDLRNSLCSGLQLMSHLEELHLTRLSITSMHAKWLTLSLKRGNPPLKILNLSHNELGNDGAQTLGRIGKVESVMSNLISLNIEGNGIDIEGVESLISALGPSANKNLTISTGLDMSRVALNIASNKTKNQTRNEPNRRQMSRTYSGGSASSSFASFNSSDDDERNANRYYSSSETRMASQLQYMEEQIKILEQEKHTLMGALSIMGASNQPGDRSILLKRIADLEAIVYGDLDGSIRSFQAPNPTNTFANRRDERPGNGMNDEPRIAATRPSIGKNPFLY